MFELNIKMTDLETKLRRKYFRDLER